MSAEAGIDFAAERAAFRVIVGAFGVKETGHALGVVDVPSPWEEAFEEVGLLALEQVIILRGVEEGLCAGELDVFGEVGGALGGVFELFVASFGDLGGAQFADSEGGVSF